MREALRHLVGVQQPGRRDHTSMRDDEATSPDFDGPPARLDSIGKRRLAGRAQPRRGPTPWPNHDTRGWWTCETARAPWVDLL